MNAGQSLLAGEIEGAVSVNEDNVLDATPVQMSCKARTAR
jgi:hypothetical protein